MKVTWKKLALRGFGPYRDGVSVILGDGVNTLIAPNERGKSSLVAGLAAVIFGLPGSSDPEQFGQARYRNWHDPSRFEGEVEFSAGGTAYRIERNFASHRIRLLRETERGWIEEVAGAHNPSAQRRNEAYEGRLRELLGIASRDVFEATFCVVQPLPEARQIDHGVQQILSGAGGAHFQKALARLTDDLKSLTRRTGELGVTSRNGRVDGALERIEASQAELEEKTRLSRDTIDSLQVIQAGLVKARERVSTASGDLKLKQDLLLAWNEWRRLAERRRVATRDQARVQEAYLRAREIGKEIAEKEQALSRDFPEYVNAVPDTGDRLEALAEVEQQITDVTGQIRAADLALANDEESRKAIVTRISQLKDQNGLSIFEKASPEQADFFRDYTGWSQRLDQEVQEARGQVQAVRDWNRTMQVPSHGGRNLIDGASGGRHWTDGAAGGQNRSDDRTPGGEPARGRRHSRRPVMALVIGVIVALLAGILGVVAFEPSLGALIGLFGGIVGSLLGWLLGERGISSQETEANTETAGAAADRLEALRVQAETRLEAALQRKREFDEAMAEARQAFGTDIAGAYQKWQDDRHRLKLEMHGLEEVLKARAADRGKLVRRLGEWEKAAAADRTTLAPILDAAGGDVREARRYLKDWNRGREEIHRLRDSLGGLLKGQGAQTPNELHEKLLTFSNAAVAAQTQLEALADSHPGLPSPDADTDPLGLEEQYRRLETEVNRLKADLSASENEIRRLLEEQARLQGKDPLNIAVAENELVETDRELVRLGLEAEALALAYRELTAAIEEYQASYRDRLSRVGGDHFSRLTGVGGRQVVLDEGFSVSVREPDGRTVAPGQLSQGAQDQLYLSLRLAIADLMAGEVSLPFVFDDPFLNFDRDRLGHVRRTLNALAEERQVLILSHREDLVDWGRPVEVVE